MTHWNNYEEKRDNIGNNDELIINENGRVKRVKATHFVGKRGLQWPKWDKWEKGDRGERGLPWQKGDTWARGEKGERWDRGASGPRGYQWPKWDKGDRGNRWPIGPQGPAGPWSWDMLNSENLSQLEDKAEARRNLWIEADFTNTLLAKLNSLDGDSYAKLSGRNEFNWEITTSLTNSAKFKIVDSNYYKWMYLDMYSQKVTEDDWIWQYRKADFVTQWNIFSYWYTFKNNEQILSQQLHRYQYNKNTNKYTNIHYVNTILEWDVSLNSNQLYFRSLWDNNYWMKWNRSIDWPEMWGHYGASLGDANNHQIIKAYKWRAYIWGWNINSCLIQSTANTTDARNQLNSASNNSMFVSTIEGRVYFYIKDSAGVKRYVKILTNWQVETWTL